MTTKAVRVAGGTDGHQRSAFSTAHCRDDPRDLTRMAAQRNGADLLDRSLCDDYARPRAVWREGKVTECQVDHEESWRGTPVLHEQRGRRVVST